jgi:hypothetical protein
MKAPKKIDDYLKYPDLLTRYQFIAISLFSTYNYQSITVKEAEEKFTQEEIPVDINAIQTAMDFFCEQGFLSKNLISGKYFLPLS